MQLKKSILSTIEESSSLSFRRFLKVPINRNFIDILVDQARTTVSSQSSPSSSLCSSPVSPTIPSLYDFACTLVTRSRVQPATLFGTLVYLDRLKTKFPSIVAKHPCAAHRVLLAALIVSGKFLNDSSPKNKHWAVYTTVFPLHDVNLMEMQLLQYLRFDLTITEAELLTQFNKFKNFSSLEGLPMSTLLPLPYQLPNTPKSAVFHNIQTYSMKVPTVKQNQQRLIVPTNVVQLPSIHRSNSELYSRRLGRRKSTLTLPPLHLPPQSRMASPPSSALLANSPNHIVNGVNLQLLNRMVIPSPNYLPKYNKPITVSSNCKGFHPYRV